MALFTYNIKTPKSARESFQINYTGEENSFPKIEIKDLLKYWPSGLSALVKPSRIITLGKIIIENISYYCVLIFVPLDEIDASGRTGLYLCNAILSINAKTIISFLVSPDNLTKFLPALSQVKPQGLKDFAHLHNLLDDINNYLHDSIIQNTIDRMCNVSPSMPVYMSTYIDNKSLCIAEFLAFYIWLNKFVSVSTYEVKPRKPWDLSFLPIDSTHKVTEVINNGENDELNRKTKNKHNPSKRFKQPTSKGSTFNDSWSLFLTNWIQELIDKLKKHV